MSGAQPKAGNISGVVSVIAEINPKAAQKRYEQGWVDEMYDSLDALVPRIREACRAREVVSMAYVGNVVDLWERLAAEEIPVDLGSDQTSLHNPWAGGYYPVDVSYEASNKMMAEEPARFRECVQESLRRQVDAINKLTARGMYFFDYGNAFLLEASRAGAAVMGEGGRFRYPSYVQDIMGPMFFDYGFGPFRWVCTSGSPEDLELTDRLAAEVLEEIRATAPAEIAGQLDDNIHWIREAGRNRLVVGSQARILYADSEGRTRIAQAFNRAVADGRLSAPVCWAATTTTCRAPTRPTARRRTSTTARTSRPTWPCRTSSATRSAAPRGCRSTMAAAWAGARSSTAASAWWSTARKMPTATSGRCCCGMSTTASPAAAGRVTRVPCRPSAARWNAPPACRSRCPMSPMRN